ncbi:MAG: serine/threonine protein kinase [Deltaproteobacteria bacterium]|nr:serine/threonine protein kinase [Deltaproteobacteria bacterium]
MTSSKKLSRGRRLGKYKLLKRIGEGGFGEVWKAKDLVEGIPVALKIPQSGWLTREHRKIFQDEVKLLAKLDHHNILKIKTADKIDHHFVIVTLCGKESLADRMRRPKSVRFIYAVTGQILSALAYAHRKKIIHRDIKPENVILFKDGTARITDFGIARVVEQTRVKGEGTGTIGYMAPEQAYGLTDFSSDVFSAGILLYELLTNQLPPWPFEWPYPKHGVLEKKVPQALVGLIKKATAFNPVRRYPNAAEMEKAWHRALKQRRPQQKKKRRKKKESLHWRDYKVQSFVKLHSRKLKLDYLCRKCEQPIAEWMTACPWCGDRQNSFRNITTLPGLCNHCEHGRHLDWKFCPWCYREGFAKASNRPSRDKRYAARCTNPKCRRPMMPWMHYCPYCHKKVGRHWKHPALPDRCPHCRWGVAKDFWSICAWCGKRLGGRS